MKRLLIVSPSFLPSTSADMHRVRLLAPYAHARGWALEILCVRPEDHGAPQDPTLLAAFPDDIPIHRVPSPSARWHRWLGMGSLYRRCRPALQTAGDRLLMERAFDLVYFSSTAFDTFTLGPRWRRHFGVPFVLDYQDPWRNDYYRRQRIRPPGGWLKFSLGQLPARWREPAVLRMAAGITAVTPRYVDDLKRRYGVIPPSRVLPFPADLTPLPELALRVPRTWTSVGRGGTDLQPAAAALAAAMSALSSDAKTALQGLELRFIGTSYAPAGQGIPSIAPGLNVPSEFRVTEQTERVPVADARARQAESERLIALLSDDPGYQPSKLAGLIQSGKPLLIVAPRAHRVHSDLANVTGVVCLPIDPHAVFSASDVKALLAPTAPAWTDAHRAAFDPQHHAEALFAFFEEVFFAQKVRR
ncbi:hypothetical protein C7S18_23015 [Ahniella affigens]|uniref:Glycosyltransferase subfamily 4-like N-terminal domain-containing protein n=1 Tax=Ahniella affigens TaxID=2021234 RepID=A0A2P1PYG6_9GAMM|nr:glycosyltransferase [Ahniella affigens]AVP99870.1 hypothetical protein C7S18_23015 [Ahniella affigens]